LQSGGIVPKGTRVNVFEQLYWVFTILGTIVGIVVIGYMLYNAYKYRDDGESKGGDADRPQLGEVPSGGGKGRKLFVSFALSAVIVISLIAWSYGTLLYVENAAADDGDQIEAEDPVDVTVVGYRFGWTFAYEGGNETLEVGEQTWENVTIIGDDEPGVLRLPADRKVRLTVTSRDVFHNIGVPKLRAKADAIPGQTTTTWIEGSDPGATYTAKCYELCGELHSYMNAEVVVMSQDEFGSWYTNTTGSDDAGA
jgi:cytochrome c oxidase subunit 2